MYWVVLLDIIVGLIIASLWGMILYGMLTSGSLVLTTVGVVMSVGIVVFYIGYALKLRNK